MKKSIILIMPNHFKIYKGFVANLEKSGFSIELVFTSAENFRYNGFGQRLTNFSRKFFLRDKKYKENLKSNFDNRRLKAKLLELDCNVDFALVIRPDYFSRETLQLLKSKVNLSVAYQWDGLERYPDVYSLIDVFDRFYLFDFDDYSRCKSVHPNVLPLTNFYFDIEMQSDEDVVEKVKKEVFFIGSLVESRLKDIIYIADIFKHLNFQLNINVLSFEPNVSFKYKHEAINFIIKPLDYLDTLQSVYKADVVLDFLDNVHNGLSFRVFESLRFSKKLITNNQSIKDYDFYSPNNILIWEKSIDKQKILEFLKKDYEKLDHNIVKKYSFSNWINNVLH